jgi:2-polyprenyl-3-methyl-5-hydroxy-6-metoxy-1,4-benzoquinol methylase
MDFECPTVSLPPFYSRIQDVEKIDLKEWGIHSGSIDTLLLADVLEHMYDPWSVLAKMRPYLAGNAQVVASIPNAQNLWLINELVSGRFSYELLGLLDVTHIRFFTRKEIKRMFKESGYEIEFWSRKLDSRLSHIPSVNKMTTLSIGKITINNVTPEELEDLKCLQFLIRARPI